MHFLNNKIKFVLAIFVFLLFVMFNIGIANGQKIYSGQQLYESSCSQCHGIEGEGFLLLYPPIRNSAYLREKIHLLPCIMRYGLKGKIVIENKEFDQIMPGVETLSIDDISRIIVFMQTAWRYKKTELQIVDWLKQCH